MAVPPQPGEIVDGYRFKGGDPKDQGNWESSAGLPPGLAQGTPQQSTIPKTGEVVDGHSFKGGDPKDPKSWDRVYSVGEAGEKLGSLDTWIKSGGKRIEELTQAVTHPIQTITQLGRVATELQPNNIATYAGLKLKALMSSGEEADKLNAQASALMGGVEPILKDYYETYGSQEKFLRTIAEDPTRLLSDLANIAMPVKGGVTAATAKAATTGAKVSGGVRAAGIAGNIIENLDVPTALINATAKLAEKSGKVISDISGMKTGVGGVALREAANAAAKGGDHLDDFRRGMAGALTEDEMVGRARTGVRTMRDNMQTEYMNKKGGLPPGPIPAWGDIQSSVDKANDSLYKTFPSGQRDTILSPADQGKWQNVMDVVERWRQDPTRHTIVGLDDLKQAVRNQLSWTDKNRNLQRAVTEVTDGILDSVKKHAPPEYAEMLAEYGPAAKLVEEIEKEFALGKNRTPQQSMTKLQSLLRNNVNTRWGHRLELADLLEQQGGVRLKSGIAGMTFNTTEPRGIARAAWGGVGGMGGGLGGFAAGLGPLGIAAAIPLGMAADWAVSNPKIAGTVAQGVGMGRRALDAKARIGNWTTPSAREVLTAPFKPAAMRGEEILGRDQLREQEGHARGGPVGQRKAAFSRYTR